MISRVPRCTHANDGREVPSSGPHVGRRRAGTLLGRPHVGDEVLVAIPRAYAAESTAQRQHPKLPHGAIESHARRDPTNGKQVQKIVSLESAKVPLGAWRTQRTQGTGRESNASGRVRQPEGPVARGSRVHLSRDTCKVLPVDAPRHHEGPNVAKRPPRTESHDVRP